MMYQIPYLRYVYFFNIELNSEVEYIKNIYFIIYIFYILYIL